MMILSATFSSLFPSPLPALSSYIYQNAHTHTHTNTHTNRQTHRSNSGGCQMQPLVMLSYSCVRYVQRRGAFIGNSLVKFYKMDKMRNLLLELLSRVVCNLVKCCIFGRANPWMSSALILAYDVCSGSCPEGCLQLLLQQQLFQQLLRKILLKQEMTLKG